MESDEALVADLARGEESALRELLRRYERPLSHFIFRHTRGQDVEDLYQETWLRVAKQAVRFDSTKRFSTWLFQIALNLCRDWHRRSVPAGDATAEPVATSDLARREAAMDAAALLANLPEAQREVVILRYYHDMTEEETASILDCPKGTVKSRMHHAMARLAALVRKEAS